MGEIPAFYELLILKNGEIGRSVGKRFNISFQGGKKNWKEVCHLE